MTCLWDWWSIYHSAMTALSPIMPEAMGKLTIRQLLCLSLEHEPTRATIKPADLVRLEEDEARRWKGDA